MSMEGAFRTTGVGAPLGVTGIRGTVLNPRIGAVAAIGDKTSGHCDNGGVGGEATGSGTDEIWVEMVVVE
ncbi:hypothetical protein SESBI_28739 [Sesbania bispinosa]|nr:hypothetical protein SESBI_28739 [Sesbania bispinosa]